MSEIAALGPQTDASQSAKASDFMHDHSVRLAGVGQLIGDTALLAYGAATKNFKVGSVGALGYAAGITGTRYGNPKVEKQLALVERDLGAYLRSQNIEIPKDASLATLNTPGGIVDGVEKFIHAYPTQIIGTCFSLMGVQFMRSGVQHKAHSLTVAGALLTAGGLSGLFLQEKKPDPAHPPQGVIEKAASWAQEKPLRLTAIFANLNQVFLAVDAFQEKKRNPGSNAYIYKLLAVCGFVMCNTMLGISSKSEGGGAKMDDNTKNELTDAAARVIAAQPKEVRDATIEHVAGFLTTQPYVNMKATEISAALQEKVAFFQGQGRAV